MSEKATAEKIDETPAQESAPEAVPEQVKPISLNRFGLAAEKRNHFLAHCKVDTKPEMVLKPDFWEHLARHLSAGDVVTIEPDDLAWETSVKVVDSGNNWANVKKREFFDYGGPTEKAADMPSDYVIIHGGQTDKYVVKYKGEVLKKGFANKSFATQFAKNHADALKR